MGDTRFKFQNKRKKNLSIKKLQKSVPNYDDSVHFCSSYGLLTSCPSICRGKLYVLTTICMDFASMVRLANLTTP